MPSNWIVLVISLVVTTNLHAATHPHIIVILADDLGYGDVGCNNPEGKIATPHIDSLARSGIRFTDGHSPASWCTPTRYGLLTGRYPFRRTPTTRRLPVIEPDRLTLPAMLASRGYRSVMIGKWHLGFDAPDLTKVHRGGPTDRGFHRYFGIPRSLDIPPYYYLENDLPVAPPTARIGSKNTVGWSPIQGEFWRAGGMAPGFKHVDVLPKFTERVEQEIREHRAEHADQPLFLYIALTAPHTPWLPTSEFAGQSDVPLYGDFVMQVDASVGRVVAALEAADMTENSLVIFSSDNGPVWYPSDEEKYGHRATSHFRGMKGDAWEGGHRMPLIMRWPGQIRAGRVSNQLTCLTDLFATCAAIVGHTLPANAGEDSFDLLPILLDQVDQTTTVRQSLIVNSTGDLLTIRQGPWKLIPFRGSGGFSQPKLIRDVPAGEPKGQLYNLDDDPSETQNLYDKHPDIVANLAALLERSQRDGRSR